MHPVVRLRTFCIHPDGDDEDVGSGGGGGGGGGGGVSNSDEDDNFCIWLLHFDNFRAILETVFDLEQFLFEFITKTIKAPPKYYKTGFTTLDDFDFIWNYMTSRPSIS